VSDFWQSELPGMPPPTADGSTQTQPAELSGGDVPNAIWATDNECDIPLLNLSLQADAIESPIVAWGSVSRSDKMSGTWHFYVDDARFKALWRNPRPVVTSACRAAVEPNFSCSDQMAVAVGLYRVYQKRWLARYWQSKGIRILVDLNVGEKFHCLNMLGVPTGWRAYATRGYSGLPGSTVREWELACERARTEDILFMVYGGGTEVQQHCMARGWVWIPERADVVKCRKGRLYYGGEEEGSPGAEEDL